MDAEQMFSLWRNNQCSMFRFTCNRVSVHPRVILKHEDNLILYVAGTGFGGRGLSSSSRGAGLHCEDVHQLQENV